MKNNSTGERIKALRLLLDFTQVEFAEKIGVTRSVLSQMEIDKSIPTFNTLKNIYEVFDVSADYFFDKGNVLPGGYLTINTFEQVENLKVNTSKNDIVSLSRLEAKFNKLIRKYLKEHHKLLSEIAEGIDQIIDLSENLNEFLQTISIDNIQETPAFKEWVKELGRELSNSDFLAYRELVVEYLRPKMRYKASIEMIAKQLAEFTIKMKPLDTNGILINTDK